MTKQPDPLNAALGVDGGAGHLKFAVRRPDGEIAHHQTAGANPILIGMMEFVLRLDQGIREALAGAGLSPADIRSAGFGLSGVDREDQVRQLSEELRTRTLPHCDRLWIGNDAMGALRQGAGKMHGVILIAGTGSICIGVDRNRTLYRAGGWGGELGDEGSAFWVGHMALRNACRMADGRRPRSALLDVVLHELELENAPDLIPWTARLTREMFKQQTATLFPAVATLADEGDAASLEILDSARGQLLQHVEAVLSRMEDDERAALDRIVCAGGVFAHNETFYEAFLDQLRETFPSLEATCLTEPASLGALALGEESNPSA